MSKIIKLKRGLDINLLGVAEKKLAKASLASVYAVTPSDYEGVTPKLLVKADDVVKAGTPLFFDKNNEQVLFTSPVSGRVAAINRGEKRKILNIAIEPDSVQVYESFNVPTLASATKEDVVSLLLASGLWTTIIGRPYGIIANPTDAPKAIFVSGFDSAPMAADMNFALADQADNLQKGIEVMAKLTTGKVHLSLKAGSEGVLNKLKGAEQHWFKGAHPAGNVGIQIHHIDPINKGETVWTVDIQNLAIIGRLFNSGKVDMSKVIALTGSEVVDAHYIQVLPGASISSILRKTNICHQDEGSHVRVISGNVLTGKNVGVEGYLGFYHNQVSVIVEGDKYEFLGWAMPRFNKFSVSRTYFSWLTPNKSYSLDTNLNGGERPLVLTGIYDKYLPMDIYPVYLLKAILAGDIDKMENLGIYEVIEEDLALCEFVDPSKTEMQQIVRDGINLMIKELN